MHDDHVSPRDFLLARPILFDELAVMSDELHIEVCMGCTLDTRSWSPA